MREKLQTVNAKKAKSALMTSRKQKHSFLDKVDKDWKEDENTEDKNTR